MSSPASSSYQDHLDAEAQRVAEYLHSLEGRAFMAKALTQVVYESRPYNDATAAEIAKRAAAIVGDAVSTPSVGTVQLFEVWNAAGDKQHAEIGIMVRDGIDASVEALRVARMIDPTAEIEPGPLGDVHVP